MIFAANIMYISVFIYAFMCANTLGAIVLKPRFKIDVVCGLAVYFVLTRGDLQRRE